jgi:hypothetical protein
MYYRCIKVQHKPINIQVRDQIQKEQKGLECAMVCGIGQCPVHQDRTRSNQPLSGKRRHAPLKFTGLSGVPPDCPVSQRGNGYLCATVDSDSATISRQKSEQRVRGALDCPVHHQTIRCHKKTKSPTVNCSRTLTVG